MKKITLFVLLFSLLVHKPYAQLTKQCFSEGDRIRFVGNSITHAGYYHYFIQLYYLLHYPKLKIPGFNCGISGNSAHHVLERMDKDILVNKPTVATIMLGMNDVNRELYKTLTPDTGILNARHRSIELYKQNVDSIAKSLTNNNCRIIFLTPSIYDQESKIGAENSYGVNDALGICTEYIKTLSNKYNAKIVDFNGEMNNINRKALTQNPYFMLAGADRIHPEIWGHFLMASIFLKTIESPKKVSLIEIDFATKKLINKENCDISNLNFLKTQLTFKCIEKSLPFPVHDNYKTALQYCTFEADYNQQVYKIHNLKKGKYILTIDNEPIDTLSNIELEKGINLARYYNTPQYKQAEKIMKLYFERHELISDNLRNLAMIDYNVLANRKKPDDINETKQLLAQTVESAKGKPWYEYMKNVTNEYLINKPNQEKNILKITEILNQIYIINQSVPHIYKLVKQKGGI
jgi:lysophospholipase L1-like esterase